MKPQSPIMVKKFGGTSVGSIERIGHVAQRILNDVSRGEKPVVVVSAMAGDTNRLISLADAIDPTYRGPAYDMLVASGEQVSVSLVAMALNRLGLKAQPLLAFQLGIHTDSIFSKARIQSIDTHRLTALVERGVVPVIAGFQGMDSEDNITVLGRGGSDTTAVALAAALGCEACEIYTDVPAVFSADPRFVKLSREISHLSYEEMMEMASVGSKVLHIRSVEIAAKYRVKIHLRSSFEKREGTWILEDCSTFKRNSGEIMEKPVVSAVTHDVPTTVFKIFPVPLGTQFLADLFQKLADIGVVVDIITQSHNENGQRLAFSVPYEDLALSRNCLQEFLKPSASSISPPEVVIMENMAKISVVGVGMRNHPGVAARFFKVLSGLGIPIHLVTTSEIKISAVIDKNYFERAINGLHREFSLDRTDSVE